MEIINWEIFRPIYRVEAYEGTTSKPIFHNWIDNYSNGFCSDQGHVWHYTGGSSGNIPEGIPCSCGAMISHYDICPTCGHERFNPRSRY